MNVKFVKSKLWIILGLLIVSFTHLYTYYIASEKTKLNNFVSEINYGFILLEALEKDKVETVKNLLAGDINRIFIEVNKDEYHIESYQAICKNIIANKISLLEKFDSQSSQINKELFLGRKRLIDFCTTGK